MPDNPNISITQWPTVTVVIPCRNAERHIAHTLDMVLANDYAAHYEVLVVEGRSEDRSLDICEEYADRYPNIRIIDNPEQHLATALNIAVTEAKGDIFLRLDAHASCRNDFIRRSVESLISHEADFVGPVLNIVPANDSIIAKCITFVWAHPLGAGTAPYKQKWQSWKGPKSVPTAPYGCMHHSIFRRVGTYDEELTRSSDLDFSRRVTASGGTILLDPNIVVEYHARGNFQALASHAFANGTMLTLPLMFHKRAFFWKHLAPFFLLLSILLSALLGVLVPGFAALAPTVLLLYTIAVIAIAVAIGTRERTLLYIVGIPPVFIVLHLGYAIGSLYGLLRALCSKRFWTFST